MANKLNNSDGKLTPYAFACGYVEHAFGPLLTITLAMPSPSAGLYRVTALQGLGERLARSANFARLSDARKFARRLLVDLSAPAIGGGETL